MTDYTQLILSLLGVLAAVTTTFFIPFIDSKTTAEQREKIRFWVNIAVNAFEQTIKGSGKGEQRKKAVLEFLASKGIKVDTDELDAMIEAEVNKLKQNNA